MTKPARPNDLDKLFGPIETVFDQLFGTPTSVLTGRENLQAVFGAPISIPGNEDDAFGTPIDLTDPRKTTLLPDWSNVHQVGRVGLIQAMAAMSPQLRTRLMEQLEAMMVVAAADRTPVSRVQQHRRQSGSTCQTMALLNGMLVVGNDAVYTRLLRWGNMASLASTIYENLPGRAGARGGAKSPHDAISYLQTHGFPELKIVSHDTNPVALLESIYQGNRFLVYSTGANHVVSWVPAPRVSKDTLVCRLDSLRPEHEPYSAPKFLQEWLRLPVGQQDVILVQT